MIMVELIMKMPRGILAKGWAWDMGSTNQTLPEIWMFTEVIQGKNMVEKTLHVPTPYIASLP